MILNNKHIQGIYLFSKDIEYEKGDFVVYENSIYICTASNPTNKENLTVIGSLPPEDVENYSVYLGDKITSSEEYFNYLENSEGKNDKYISSNVLSEILNHYMNGFDSKGIIDYYVELKNDDSLIYSSDLTEILSRATKNDVLNIIINNQKLNNAIFRISRNLLDGFLSPIGSIPNVSDLEKSSVILKQYSYFEISNPTALIRVQEIIDHVNGTVLYRYGEVNSGKVSLWKNSSVNEDFRTEVTYVKNYYIKKSEELLVEKESLKKNFGFRNCNLIKSESVNIQCNDENELGYIDSEGFNQPTLITIVIQEPYLNRIYKNSSITIDLSDSILDNITEYVINNTCTLAITSPTVNSINLRINSGRIVNIYYRQFFKHE